MATKIRKRSNDGCTWRSCQILPLSPFFLDVRDLMPVMEMADRSLQQMRFETETFCQTFTSCVGISQRHCKQCSFFASQSNPIQFFLEHFDMNIEHLIPHVKECRCCIYIGNQRGLCHGRLPLMLSHSLTASCWSWRGSLMHARSSSIAASQD